MDKIFKISIFLLIALILLGITIQVILNHEPQLSPEEIEPCNIIEKNTNPGEGINILFFSSKENAENYTNYFKTISPYNENKEAFNFYYIDTYKPDCEIYKNKALLCYNRETILKASSCPNDIIVVMQEEKSSIRSSAYMNLISLNEKHSKSVLVHEFGHVFVNLADEYTPAKIPKNSENCQESCENFYNKEDCFQGCSETDYYRSIDRGIMRTLSSEDYGEFNKKIIQKKIDSIISGKSKITGKAILEEETEKEYILIEGKYNSKTEEMEIIKETFQKGFISQHSAGDFNYQIYDNKNNTISEEFNPQLIFTDTQESSNEEIEGSVETSEKEFYLKIPQISNAEKMEIRKDKEVLSEINLKEINKRKNSVPCKIN